MKDFRDTGVAMVTPFKASGEVDFPALEKLTNHLVEGGVDYLVVQGTTGESATLTQSEKQEVLDYSLLSLQNYSLNLLSQMILE